MHGSRGYREQFRHIVMVMILRGISKGSVGGRFERYDWEVARVLRI